MKIIQQPLLLILLLVLASCAPQRMPFTQQLREKHQLTPDELKKIQFYTSNDLILRRGDNKNSKATDDGALTVMNDGVVEEVVIKAGTPCVIKEVIDGNRLTVSFEDGSNRYPVFASIKNRDGYYTLQ